METLLATTLAEAAVEVRSHQSTPYAEGPGPALTELRIEEVFAGDIEGESVVRALQVQHNAEAASLTSLQRFVGTLAGRRGSFVLQGSGTVQKGKIASIWSVVPGSGTDELAGLRGKGGFKGEFGKGSHATLDCWFE